MYKYDYLIIGPGAMGLFFAAHLRNAGLPVAILDYKPERAATLNDNGINLLSGNETITVSIPVTCNPQIAAQSRVSIIMTKAYSTANAGRLIQPYLNDNTVLTIQNGLGNIETLTDIINNKKIIAGSTTRGAYHENINTVHDTGSGITTIGNNSPLSITICDDFIKAGLNAEISENILQVIWGKAVINSAINPLGALTRRKNGELLLSEELLDLMRVIINESTAVAKGMGINLSFDEYLDKIINICHATAGNTNSMLSDILNNKRTEIDAINGKITGYGEKLNIPVPVNKTLWQLIKGLENQS